MTLRRRGGIRSALLRLLSPGGEPSTQGLKKGPRRFQGRPVVKMMWEGEEVEAVQGLVAYRVRDPNRSISRDEAADALDAPVHGTSAPNELGIGVIATDEDINAERAAAAAERLGSDMMWTEPVLLDYGALHPNDASFTEQWGLREINAERAWDLWNGDPNSVVLAILDSGIAIQASQLSHPDLNESRFHLGPDFVNNDAEPRDDHGHGTHIAGIAAATKGNGFGVAGLWPGQVFIVKVFNDKNEEKNVVGTNVIFQDGVKAAVNFARQVGARLVINYSGGGPDSASKRAGVQHALDNNALVVAAAGNSDAIIHPAFLSTQFSNVIAVGAINKQRERPSFASRGPQMTVVAPGTEIFSTLPNYSVTLTNEGFATTFDTLEGTSQATALVSALAALVWSKSPHLTATQVRDRITQTATPIPGSSSDFGSGLINAEAALS
jgi:thermitase